MRRHSGAAEELPKNVPKVPPGRLEESRKSARLHKFNRASLGNTGTAGHPDVADSSKASSALPTSQSDPYRHRKSDGEMNDLEKAVDMCMVVNPVVMNERLDEEAATRIQARWRTLTATRDAAVIRAVFAPKGPHEVCHDIAQAVKRVRQVCKGLAGRGKNPIKGERLGALKRRSGGAKGRRSSTTPQADMPYDHASSYRWRELRLELMNDEEHESFDDEIYAADKAARKIQMMYHIKTMRGLQSRIKSAMLVNSLSRASPIGRAASIERAQSCPTLVAMVCGHKTTNDPDSNEAKVQQQPAMQRSKSLPHLAGCWSTSGGSQPTYGQLQSRLSGVQQRLSLLQELEERERCFEAKLNKSVVATTMRVLRAVGRSVIKEQQVIKILSGGLGIAPATEAKSIGNLQEESLAATSPNTKSKPLPRRPEAKYGLQARARQMRRCRLGRRQSALGASERKQVFRVDIQLQPAENQPLSMDSPWETSGLQLGRIPTRSEIIILGITGGAVQRWNEEMRLTPRHMRLRPGDRIVRVGETSVLKWMARELMAPTQGVLSIEAQMSTLREAETYLREASPLQMNFTVSYVEHGSVDEFAALASLARNEEARVENSVAVKSVKEFVASTAVGSELATDVTMQPPSSQVRQHTEPIGLTGAMAVRDRSEMCDRTMSNEFMSMVSEIAEQGERSRAMSGLLDMPLPLWLSPQMFGPCLRTVICELPSAEAVMLLEVLEHSEGEGSLGKVVDSETWTHLYRIAHSVGGHVIWAVLLAGASSSNDGANDQSSCHLWREALWRVGIASLEQKRKEIATGLSEWCLNTVSADWGKQLVRIEETLGWCCRNLDAMRAPLSMSSMYTKTERFDVALAEAHLAAALRFPDKSRPQHLMLRPRARDMVRSLEADRRERCVKIAQNERTTNESHPKISISTLSAKEPGACLSFDEFKRLVGNTACKGSSKPSAASMHKVQKHQTAGRISMVPRFRKLRVS